MQELPDILKYLDMMDILKQKFNILIMFLLYFSKTF